jgi:hypothetical protein
MAEEPGTHALVVRLNEDLGRTLLADSEPTQLRLAPSVRGVDLAGAGAVILLVAGHAADFVTLMLAREHVNTFAARLSSILHRRSGRDGSGRLKVSLRSPTGQMSVDLRTSDPSRLADALRALAEVSETTTPPGDT